MDPPPENVVVSEGRIGQEQLDEIDGQEKTTPDHQETWQLRVHFVRWGEYSYDDEDRDTIKRRVGERNG